MQVIRLVVAVLVEIYLQLWSRQLLVFLLEVQPQQVLMVVPLVRGRRFLPEQEALAEAHKQLASPPSHSTMAVLVALEQMVAERAEVEQREMEHRAAMVAVVAMALLW